jgi:hypothetical protein
MPRAIGKPDGLRFLDDNQINDATERSGST